METRSRQGLRRFQVEVWSYGNYVERIADLERALAKKPRVLRIEIVGTGEIPADVALRFRSVLMERSPKTRIVTNARSSLKAAQCCFGCWATAGRFGTMHDSIFVALLCQRTTRCRRMESGRMTNRSIGIRIPQLIRMRATMPECCNS